MNKARVLDAFDTRSTSDITRRGLALLVTYRTSSTARTSLPPRGLFNPHRAAAALNTSRGMIVADGRPRQSSLTFSCFRGTRELILADILLNRGRFFESNPGTLIQDGRSSAIHEWKAMFAIRSGLFKENSRATLSF